VLVRHGGFLHRRTGYLVEWKPIHTVLSATVYAEIKKERREGTAAGDLRLAAFGDPSYPAHPLDAASPALGEAVRRGLSLTPLPASRQEVEGIASLFPETRTYLGAAATEENAKAIAPHARLLHFACHGLLDERLPLSSALALSIPEQPREGQDNGLLQAWEIFESVRLDADLVTLSACDSALGKEMGGEGLIGLTRAFQYAGARSVLASLWSVSDASTAELMRGFYGALRQRKTKDEALRAAQLALIHGPQATSHPYHWAAFQLSGDWR
jgi:CHAT domain-containing protein